MTRRPLFASWLWLALVTAPLVGCADDPVYVQAMTIIEAGADDETASASAQLYLPVRLETEEEAMERGELEAELGTMLSQVRREDLDLSVEWTLKNLSEETAIARVQLTGANEWFAYVPLNFVEDLDDADEESPPPLLGDVPMELLPGKSRSGVFREDELAEASLDLELITRGEVTPFAAILGVNEDLTAATVDGALVPVEHLAQLVRIDLTLLADQHVVLEYAVRVRDHRDPKLLHQDLAAAPGGELVTFAPADFVPPPPEPAP